MTRVPRLAPLAACCARRLRRAAPAGPSLQALPGSRLSFEQFQVDDAACRQYATAQIGGRSATEAAQESQAASAVAGTAIGAAAGAAFGGSSEAAAVGAGIGLLTGAMAGWGSAEASYYAAQRRYDGAYYQCMYARGHKVPVSSRYSEAGRASPRSRAPRRARRPTPRFRRRTRRPARHTLRAAVLAATPPAERPRPPAVKSGSPSRTAAPPLTRRPARSD